MSVASFFGMIVNLDENMARMNEFLRQSELFDNGETVGAKVFNAGIRLHGRSQPIELFRFG